MITTKSPENAEIKRVYGNLLDRSQARLKNLSIEELQPAPNTIVIKQADAETLTDGGIHLPENAVKRPAIGTVVAIHQDEDFYEVGDLVVIRSCVSGTPISLKSGDEFIVLQCNGTIDDEVLGRFPANGLEPQESDA